MHLYKNLQSNAPVDSIYQMIYYMSVTKDMDRKVYDFIWTWGSILA